MMSFLIPTSCRIALIARSPAAHAIPRRPGRTRGGRSAPGLGDGPPRAGRHPRGCGRAEAPPVPPARGWSRRDLSGAARVTPVDSSWDCKIWL